METKAMQSVKELLSHHRRFTPFQKVLTTSIFMGVILCLFRSWWSLWLIATYTVTLYSSVSVTKYILVCKTLLPSDVILSTYDSVIEFVSNLISMCNNKQDSPGDNAHYTGTEHDRSSKRHSQDTRSENDSISVLSNKNDLNSTLHFKKHILSPLTAKVNEEIHVIIRLIKRDFFESWYHLFSNEVTTLNEAEALFNHVCDEFEGRLKSANVHKVCESILLLFKDHLHYVHQAKTTFKVQSKKSRRKSQVDTNTWSFAKPVVFTSIEECYGSKVGLHPAAKSTEIEHVYQKSIIGLLLVHVLWEDMLVSQTLVCALKEILMCNILQNVVDLLCESTFLHEMIIKITSDEELCVTGVNIPTITLSETEPQDEDVNTTLTRLSTHSMDKLHDSKTDLTLKQNSESDQLDTNKNNENEAVPDSEGKDEKIDVKWKEDLQVFPVSNKICFECNRLASDDKDRISPRPHSCSLGTTPVFFIPDFDQQSVNSISTNSSTDFKNCLETCEEEEGTENVTDNSDSGLLKERTDNLPAIGTPDSDTVSIRSENTDSEMLYTRDRVLSTSSESEEKPSSNFISSLRFNLPNPLNLIDRKRLSPSTEVATLTCDNVEIRRSKSHGDVISDVISESEETPSVFQDVRITGTETAKERTSQSEYTLYTIEFEALYQSEDGGLVHKTGVVKRRHSEFVNLQSRLDDNPRCKKSMKDIKGPKKILPSLPFGNMGKDTVDNRRQLLESFLKSLIAKPELCNSKEVEQFMGYSGDGHIAFVRKIPENTGPRIDQRVVKTMSDVFDKIVEGFPSLPQQLPRIIPQFEQAEDKEVKPDIQLSGPDNDEMDLVYDYIEDTSTSELSSVLEKYVSHKVTSGDPEHEADLNNTTLGTSMLSWQDQQKQQQKPETSDYQTDHMTSPMTQNQKRTPSISIQSVQTLECPLSNAALDLLTEILQRQDHWMCRDNVIIAIKVLFGKGLNRLIEEKVDIFTSADMILFYMKTFHETMWPNDELSTEQRPQYNDLQKEQLRQQATRCLTEFLPGILTFLIGDEESDIAIEEIFETLKYEQLNRHFWYTALDIILEELFPEVNTQELQRKLSGSMNSA